MLFQNMSMRTQGFSRAKSVGHNVEISVTWLSIVASSVGQTQTCLTQSIPRLFGILDS